MTEKRICRQCGRECWGHRCMKCYTTKKKYSMSHREKYLRDKSQHL